MAKTKLSHRLFAVILALLFLVTSLGFSVVVIWQLVHKPKTPEQIDQAALQKALQNAQNKLAGTKLHGFTPLPRIDQLQEIDSKIGTGEEVKAGATVTAHYTGAVAATGIIFQSSHDNGQPASFALTEVIPGWTEGVPGMKVGGTRRLLIPAAQAYGANPPAGSNIPPNADLVFDIELVSVQNP